MKVSSILRNSSVVFRNHKKWTVIFYLYISRIKHFNLVVFFYHKKPSDFQNKYDFRIIHHRINFEPLVPYFVSKRSLLKVFNMYKKLETWFIYFSNKEIVLYKFLIQTRLKKYSGVLARVTWLSVIWCTKGSLVQFPVTAHAQVAGLVPGRDTYGRHPIVSLSLPPSL